MESPQTALCPECGLRTSADRCSRCGHVMAEALEVWSTSSVSPTKELNSPALPQMGLSSPDTTSLSESLSGVYLESVGESARGLPSGVHEGCGGTMRGFLWKQSRHLREWRLRWFKLDEMLLFFYKPADRCVCARAHKSRSDGSHAHEPRCPQRT